MNNYTIRIIGHPERDINLCLLPSTIDTAAWYEDSDGHIKTDLVNLNELMIKGFDFDQVADEYRDGCPLHLVKVFGDKTMTYTNFRHEVLLREFLVDRIIFQAIGQRDFLDDIEISIQRYTPPSFSCRDYLSVRNYRTKPYQAVIDLCEKCLILTKETLMSVNVPKRADLFITLSYQCFI